MRTPSAHFLLHWFSEVLVPLSAATPDEVVRHVFRYLAEVGESRTRPVRTHDDARHQVWFADLPEQFASFLTEVVPADAPLWLRAPRPLRQDPPAPPLPLAHWLDGREVHDSDRDTAPAPRTHAEIPADEVSAGGTLSSGRTTVALEDFPQRDVVRDQHRAWAPAWEGWARRDRAAKPVVRAYDRLYRLCVDASELGESFELVVGFGYLTWSAQGEPIRRHLVTCRAVISIDPDTGAITVGPDPEQGSPVLEESMLDAGQKARADIRALVRQELDAAGDTTDPMLFDQLHRALTTWTIAAHEAGRYDPSPARHRASGDPAVPLVGFAPVLLLRERTRRSMLEALRGVAVSIEQGAEPTALLRAIAGAGGDRPLGEPATAGGRGEPPELYFALPSNDEQRTIAERLRDRDLVVVQGPPGTGKTHTIANLVTDLLAHGNRVLITSHTARALKVLRDKLPASVRELCVSRTDDGAGQQELEQSVKALLDRQGDFDPRVYRRRIEEHEERLRSARSAQARALKTLRALREQETFRHPVEIGDYEGTLARIAERLAEERPRFAWIGPVPGAAPTLDAAALTGLRRAALAFTDRHRALAAAVTAALPEPGQLPSGPDFADAVRTIRAAEADLAALRQDGSVSRLDDAVSALTAAGQERLAAVLDRFTAGDAAAAALPADWAAELRRDVLAGQDVGARSRHERTTAALTAIDEAARALGSTLVSGLEAYDVPTALGLATTLRDGLAAGEKLRGTFGMKTRLRKAVGEFPETVRVDGRAVETEAAAAVVLHRITLERHLQDIEREWGDGADAWQPGTRRVARLHQDAASLATLTALAGLRAEVVRAAADAPGLAGVDWGDTTAVGTLRSVLRARAARRAADPARALIDAALVVLRAAAHRRGAPAAVDRARAAAETHDPAAYSAAVGDLDDLREALARKAECDDAYRRVAAELPEVADTLESAPEDPAWDTRLADFEAAWAWSAWHARMTELTDPEAENRQLRLLTEADAEIRISLERLAADRAWYNCLSRLTDDQAVALTSYQQNVRRLGKGTGKYAATYRRQARESLQASQEAVPAWIMPLHQVTETVPMDRAGRFDVVIIDEASQSGPEALLLAWLGAKVIVVGDDQQVSPAQVGVDHDEQFALQRRLLGELPAARRNLFTPTASLFDIASGLAGGRGRLMLQEHFRCMPEIIGFSNELCYGGRLQPLRQYGADRLPPLRSVHVADGHVEGSGQKQINRPEAERLVEQVARCIADPAYAGRTMGVITLLGAGQKFLIEDLLADRVPLDERQRRRLRVGNAEEFQGDERDIVFIGLVTSLTGPDGPRRIGSYNSALYRQHINVAASRARDQVWLFHSVALTELGETDLRRAYLDWFSRPAEEQDGIGLGDVRPDVPHEAFDSLFEQRVYLALRARGYRVRPQYRAGRYRIDLVVEGGTRRLAVECDGDAFHTEENADADAARQRELERVGWTFVRIRGSRFFLDPERALEPLWAQLERLGIETAAQLSRDRAASETEAPGDRPRPALPTAPDPAPYDGPHGPVDPWRGAAADPAPYDGHRAHAGGRHEAAPEPAGPSTDPRRPASRPGAAAAEAGRYGGSRGAVDARRGVVPGAASSADPRGSAGGPGGAAAEAGRYGGSRGAVDARRGVVSGAGSSADPRGSAGGPGAAAAEAGRYGGSRGAVDPRRGVVSGAASSADPRGSAGGPGGAAAEAGSYDGPDRPRGAEAAPGDGVRARAGQPPAGGTDVRPGARRAGSPAGHPTGSGRARGSGAEGAVGTTGAGTTGVPAGPGPVSSGGQGTPAAAAAGDGKPELESVARLHRDEVNAAQHAFSMGRSVKSTARFLAGVGVPGFPGADAVEVLRAGRAVVRVAHAEIQALIRAVIAHADVPVLGPAGQTGLARYHAPGSAGGTDGRTTELLRVRPAAPRPAAGTLPAVPRQPARAAEPAPVPPPRAAAEPVPVPPPRAAAGPSGPDRVDRLSPAAHRRVHRELQRVQDALDQPAPEIVAVDSSSRQAQLADHDRRRAALRQRRSFLRDLLDRVTPDSAFAGGSTVVPGCLVGVEYPDEPGVTTYEIAMLAGDEAERLSPDSALGRALMGREVGDEVSWLTERGAVMRVVVRYVED
ncbi:AAA domain-containing protein [Streptomyces sp. NPDC001381]|uniref:AAA domain-containing protein n=1 Tax=Streptomyces sp. NPDC001381 TaxID=3364567 RepID=UPI0036C9F8F8